MIRQVKNPKWNPDFSRAISGCRQYFVFDDSTVGILYEESKTDLVFQTLEI